MDHSYDIPELISKKILGMLTDSEEQVLRRWCEAAPENEVLYRELTHRDFLRQRHGTYGRIDSRRAYERLQARMQTRRRGRAVRKFVAAAAVFAVAITLGLLFIPSPVEPSSGEQAIIPPGIRTAVLIQQETVSVLSEDALTGMALGEGVRLLENHTGITYQNPAGADLSTEIRYNTLQVPRGGKYCVVLSDGTEVHLNSQSELRFPVAFAEGERRVFLTGEAYFQVENNPEAPFIVELSSRSEIRVLGTRFNVRDYPEETAQVLTLEQGSVRYEGPAGRITLEPGEQLTAHEYGEITRRKVDTELFTAWKEGMFAFSDMRLEELLTNMARWYRIDVRWSDESLKEILFSGRIYDYHDFQSVIRMLELTGSNRFLIEGNTIYVQK